MNYCAFTDPHAVIDRHVWHYPDASGNDTVFAYDDIRMDLDEHTVHVRQMVTWTNRHERPAQELVFNAHSHYQVTSDEIGFMAKILELLR